MAVDLYIVYSSVDINDDGDGGSAVLDAPDELVLRSMWERLRCEDPRLSRKLAGDPPISRLRRAVRSLLGTCGRALAAQYVAAYC